MPGAWENDTGLVDYPKFRVSDIRSPSRSPDFEMSFLVGPLIDGEQAFDHISSIRRREVACHCFFFGYCPHEPQFARYDMDGELDLCSCLDENGCECRDEVTNYDGSELESEAESIDNSTEDEERSDESSEIENEDESISDSSEYEEEQKEGGVLEGESENSNSTKN
ncbi:hypothetical protein BOTCAL_0003g00640 [Botryotinia calthae]|uniref:Uncharacterized protein n=1 Tax=Botryotinia calthae TaxID=38488 RepID=A0A4Y8DHJ5_9HELO|nr:hypothetical protein BOTCAL_0003g00640 [Botryotinia calthae]